MQIAVIREISYIDEHVVHESTKMHENANLDGKRSLRIEVFGDDKLRKWQNKSVTKQIGSGQSAL